MEKDPSALSLSFLDLSDFPKYVMLRSEFSSNLVVSLIFLIEYLHMHPNILPLVYLVLGQNIILLYPSPSLYLNCFCIY